MQEPRQGTNSKDDYDTGIGQDRNHFSGTRLLPEDQDAFDGDDHEDEGPVCIRSRSIIH